MVECTSERERKRKEREREKERREKGGGRRADVGELGWRREMDSGIR